MNLQRQHRLLIAAAIACGVHALLAGALLQGRRDFVANAPVPPPSMPESAAAEPADEAPAKADEPKAAAAKPAESAEAAKLVQALQESQPAEDAPAAPASLALQVPDRAKKIAATAPVPAQALKAAPAVKASKVDLAAASAPAPVPIPPPAATPTPASGIVRSTAPPSSSDDDQPAKAVSPAAVSATSSPAALENYAKSVRWRLSKYMHELPAGAKGEARVQFTVKPDGKVSNIQLVQSSGHAGLDALATQLPEQAQPLPSPGAKPVRIEIPIQAAAPK